MQYLVFHTRVGDGTRVRTVDVDWVEAVTLTEARERVEARYGEGAIRVVKIDTAGATG